MGAIVDNFDTGIAEEVPWESLPDSVLWHFTEDPEVVAILNKRAPRAASAWDALVVQFSPRTASMNAILADSEGWRKWCEANPEKCEYVPKTKRLQPLQTPKPKPGKTRKLIVSQDLTMKGLPAKTVADVKARFKTSLSVTPKVAGANMDAIFDQAIENPKMAAYATWYNDAHEFAGFAASTEGRDYDPDVAASVVAALSPGGEWNENMRQADIVLGSMSRNETIDPDHANELLSKENDEGEVATDFRLDGPMTLRELAAVDPRAAGIVIAREPRGDNGTGFPLRTYDNVTKAVILATANDSKIIDETLTGAKVRSFFNNISEPDSTAGDVTIDKHMQRALSVGVTTDEAVIAARVNKIEDDQSALTGSPAYASAGVGAYPLMADVVRAATARANERHGLSLTANQFQAVVWGWQTLTYRPERMRSITDKAKTASCDDCGAIVAEPGESARERWARWDAEHPRERSPREKRRAEGVEAIKEALLRDGGFTINYRTGKLITTGYTAAIKGHSSITPASEFFQGNRAQEEIDAWLEREGATFDSDESLNFGGWYDRANDEIVLDPAKNFTDEAEARQRGTEWDQQYIYDHANNREIPTGGTGQRVASCDECHGPIVADTAGWRKWCEENPDKCGGEAKVREKIPGEQELFDPDPFTHPGPSLDDVLTPPEFVEWEKDQAEIAEEVRVDLEAEEAEAAEEAARQERALDPIMGDENPGDPDYVPKAGALPSWTPDSAVDFMEANPEYFDAEAIGYQVEGLRQGQGNRDAWIAEMSEDDQVWLSERVSQYYSTGRVVTRVNTDVLEEILADGQWETQFTTGTSGGMYDPEARRHNEGLFMGVDMDEAEGRPVYATWMTPDTDPDLTSQYGNVEVIMKRDVESRSTVTLRDSLGTETFAQPFSVMRNGSMRQQALADQPFPGALQELFDGNTPSNYTEVQIHGGLKTPWIEHVVFRESHPLRETAGLMGVLDEHGIPWSVIPDYGGEGNEYPVEWEVSSDTRAAGLRHHRDQRPAVGRPDADHHQRQATQAGLVRVAHERGRIAGVGSCDDCHQPIAACDECQRPITADTAGWRKWCEENPEKCGGGPKDPAVEKKPPAKVRPPEVLEQARLLAEEARQIEPAVTAMMEALAERHGGELVGLAHRLKAESGLARKIEADMAEKGLSAADAAKGLSDSVRYTVSFDPKTYTGSTEAVLAEVRATGFGVRVKNFWAPGDPYNGVNVKMKDPTTGREIELQFHTAASLVAKNEQHGIYEAYRVLPKGDPAADEMYDRMVAISDDQEFPEGVERLGPLLTTPRQ